MLSAVSQVICGNLPCTSELHLRVAALSAASQHMYLQSPSDIIIHHLSLPKAASADQRGPHLACACVRREEELAAVARIQAQAFYEPSPIAPLDSLLYYIFQVLISGCLWVYHSCCMIAAADLERSCIALSLVQSVFGHTARSQVKR